MSNNRFARATVACIALMGFMFLFFAAITGAFAQTIQRQVNVPCASINIDVAGKIAGGEHKEHVRATGLTSKGEMMRMFVNPETRTWTIIMTVPKDGMHCFLASGEYLEESDPPAKPPVKGSSS